MHLNNKKSYHFDPDIIRVLMFLNKLPISPKPEKALALGMARS